MFKKFEPELKNISPTENSLLFIFIGNDILLIEDGVPLYKNIQSEKHQIKYQKCIGKIGDKDCFLIEINHKENIEYPGEFIYLRNIYTLLPQGEVEAALFAWQVCLWSRCNKYCGGCGSLTIEDEFGEILKVCPECNLHFYPKISPSIIVAIKKDDKLLMAHHSKSTRIVYSLIAGFVNPCETLEDCVVREVKEESGIEIKNIKYYGSQPWPFPDSLMLGFTADYAGGELTPDNNEIIDLKWFKAEEIPDWPDSVSIARKMIDEFIETNKKF